VLARLASLAKVPSLASLPKVPSLASLPKVPSLPKAARIAAFGVFFGLEVLDFDFLTFLCCHIIFLSGWFGWFVLCQ
jgi:hypothetical protein